MKIKLNDKVYNVLKYLCLIGLPAISVLWNALSSIWGWGYIEQVCGTISAIALFIGALIGVSTYSYNQEIKETLIDDYINEDDQAFNSTDVLE